MCLMLTVIAHASDRDKFETVSRRTGGLTLNVEHLPRWPWARDRPVRATISENGTCSCSLLSDDADWNAEVWRLRPEILERLASTLEQLVAEVTEGFRIEALWVGESPLQTVQVSADRLVELTRTNQFGTRTRYEVAS